MRIMLTEARGENQSIGRCLAGTAFDRLLLVVLLLAVAAAWFWIEHRAQQGPPMVHIYHGRQLLAIYPLPQDARVIHYQAQGSIGIADIEISRQGVRMRHAPCASQRCVRSGVHHRVGDMIICVPNRILVSIEGGGRPWLDGIAE